MCRVGTFLQVPAEVKLPCLYLLDSIVKNHPSPYKDLFQRNLVHTFATVFAAVQEVTVRSALYKLRTTWNEVFNQQALMLLDVKVNKDFDPKWPVAKSSSGSNIHINPAVFNKQKQKAAVPPAVRLKVFLVVFFVLKKRAFVFYKVEDEETALMEREVLAKKKELMRLQKLKLEMELEKTRKELEGNVSCPWRMKTVFS